MIYILSSYPKMNLVVSGVDSYFTRTGPFFDVKSTYPPDLQSNPRKSKTRATVNPTDTDATRISLTHLASYLVTTLLSYSS